jgi:copper chaperone NosL
MNRAGAAVVAMAALIAGCGGEPRPVPPAIDQDACAHCRMIVSDVRFAAQIVTAAGDPVYFDDLTCLADHLRAAPLPSGAAVFVVDHRTREWIDARQAIYTRADAVTGPMGSHVIAHRSTATREADPDAASGTIITLAEALPALAPGGR